MISQFPVHPLARWVRPEHVVDGLAGSNAEEVLEALATVLARDLREVPCREIFLHMLERERLGSTAVGRGFAMPHCRLAALSRVHLVVARGAAAVDFGAPDGAPVRVYFALATPAATAGAHLQALSTIARWLKDEQRGHRLLSAADRESMVSLLCEAD